MSNKTKEPIAILFCQPLGVQCIWHSLLRSTNHESCGGVIHTLPQIPNYRTFGIYLKVSNESSGTTQAVLRFILDSFTIIYVLPDLHDLFA